MDLGKLKEIIMNEKIFIISVLIGVVTLIGSVTFYNYQEMAAMKSNIESAIVKGIDPLAVRCAYAKNNDIICVAYSSKNSK
jgi:uncharacterized membrane protein